MRLFPSVTWLDRKTQAFCRGKPILKRVRLKNCERNHGELRKEWITYRLHISKNMNDPAPAICVISRFFDKIDSFLEKFLNVFRIKKGNCIFEELPSWYLNVLLISFFPLLLWVPTENRTKLKNSLSEKCPNTEIFLVRIFLYLDWIQENMDQRKTPHLDTFHAMNCLFELQNQAEHSTTNLETATDYSSVTAIVLVIFWTERDFCIISDCRNSFNNKLKNAWAWANENFL